MKKAVKKSPARTATRTQPVKKSARKKAKQPKKTKTKKKQSTPGKHRTKSKNKGIKNLKPPWKKGQSGNPNGRPKGVLNYKTIARRYLNMIIQSKNKLTKETENLTVQERLILDDFHDALFGSKSARAYARRNLADRLYGTPKQTIDPKGDELRDEFDFSNLKDKELEYINSIAEKTQN